MARNGAFTPPPLPNLANLRHTATAALAALALTLTPCPAHAHANAHASPFPPTSSITRPLHARRMFATAPVVVFDKDYRIPSLLQFESTTTTTAPAPATATATSKPSPPATSAQAGQRAQPQADGRPLPMALPPRPRLSCEIRVLTRLLVALVVGGIIGMERRAANSLAGVRTFSLVSLGAAIFMSTTLVSFPRADPTRVAAAISSGVGFLGAGAMHKDPAKHSRGLTTASSVWLAAALGIAAACGMFLLSFMGAISTVLIARYARFDSSLHLIRGDPLGDEGFGLGKRLYADGFDVKRRFEVSVVDFDPSRQSVSEVGERKGTGSAGGNGGGNGGGVGEGDDR